VCVITKDRFWANESSLKSSSDESSLNCCCCVAVEMNVVLGKGIGHLMWNFMKNCGRTGFRVKELEQEFLSQLSIIDFFFVLTFAGGVVKESPGT